MKIIPEDNEDQVVLCTETLIIPTVKTWQSLIKVYSLRYWMIRHLTCSVPYLPFWLTQGKSVLEWLFLEATFLIFLIITQNLDSQNAGQLTADVACAMIVFALRNNILTVVFGISFERALFWHKAAARLTIAMGVIHAIINYKTDTVEEFQNYKTGLTLLILIITASLSYFLLKKKNFEIFYYFHILLYFVIVVIAAIHGASTLSFSMILWVVDIITRYYFTLNKVQADVTVLSNDIIKISFKKSFDYSSGQYCFISVPGLSSYQFHVSLIHVIC